MKHLKSVNRKAQRIAHSADSRNDVVALQAPPPRAEPAHSAGLHAYFLAGLGGGSATAELPGCASLWSAICSIATRAASGQRKFPIS